MTESGILTPGVHLTGGMNGGFSRGAPAQQGWASDSCRGAVYRLWRSVHLEARGISRHDIRP